MKCAFDNCNPYLNYAAGRNKVRYMLTQQTFNLPDYEIVENISFCF